MDITLIVKIAGTGLLVAISYQILNKAGRDEQAMMVSLAGVILVMFLLVQEIGTLFDKIRNIFGF